MGVAGETANKWNGRKGELCAPKIESKRRDQLARARTQWESESHYKYKENWKMRNGVCLNLGLEMRV